MPLDPSHLTPAASLNRVRIVEMAGITLPDDIQNKTGFDLISTQALAALIRQNAETLKLSPADLAQPDHELPPLLNLCFVSDYESVHQEADRIARCFGRGLGWLLLTLKRGDAVNRAVHDDWDETYWAHWAQTTSVYLSGGLSSGRLGELARLAALEVLNDNFYPGELRITLDTIYNSALPLAGVARYAPPGCAAALVLDFGSTHIKSAVARYTDSTLTELLRLPATTIQHSAPGSEKPRLAWMIATITEAWKQAGDNLAPLIPASIAAYIQPDGQPCERPGSPYAELRAVTDNLQAYLSQQVSQQVGQPVEVRLIHDGTAAASLHAAPYTATLLLGTAIGVGFAPLPGELRPRADSVPVRDFTG